MRREERKRGEEERRGGKRREERERGEEERREGKSKG